MAIIGAFMVPHPPIIVAEVGHGEERKINKTIGSYQQVAREIAALKPDTIVITTPHSVLYSDYFHISPGTEAKGDFGEFGAPQVGMHVQYNQKFVQALSQMADDHDLMAGTMGEKDKALDHATMVPLYFINQAYKNYQVVRIGLSGQSLLKHYTLGTYIKAVSEKLADRTVFIASGDLSHVLKNDGPYGYKPEGPKYDAKLMAVMRQAKFKRLFDFDESFCQKASECGHRSFVIMAGALDQTAVEPRALSYEGPFGVGYGVCTYHIKGPDKTRDFGVRYQKEEALCQAKIKAAEDPYVQLARKALEAYVSTKEIIAVPKDTTADLLNRQAGTFVSLKIDGYLRGCIGTIVPTKASIAEEIIHNAISAAVYDPRFSPVTKSELPALVYSVDVLGETEKVTEIEALDPKRYGVIVTHDGKRGLLLPNLDGIDTVEEQIAIAKEKAGIPKHQPVAIERFEVIRHA